MNHTNVYSSGQQMTSMDSCLQVIASFMDALQKNFKEDTHYAYPLMPAQANTLFALDGDMAVKMKSYVSTLMKDFCGFTDGDFSITLRPSAQEGGIYKLRVEFTKGIDFDLMRMISEKTVILEERLLQRKASQ